MKAKYLTSIGAILSLGITSGAAFAQQSPQPVQPSQTNPQGQPNPQGQQAPQGREVSQEELRKFANAIKKLQPIQQEAQTQLSQIIQQSNMSEQRFSEIYQSRQNPQTKPTTAITPEENQKFDQANSKIQEIEKSTQSKMEQAVQGEGLDIKRFNQIFVAVRSNPSLLQKVREMVQS